MTALLLPHVKTFLTKILSEPKVQIVQTKGLFTLAGFHKCSYPNRYIGLH